MAGTTTTLAAGEFSSGRLTLQAGQVDEVDFTAVLSNVEVITDGTAWVWVTADGSTPVADGHKSYGIPPSSGWIARDIQVFGNATQIKLISAAAVVYIVSRI